MSAEQARLDEARSQKAPWKKWGPYLSERQWGTVREDYSEGGNAWDYFSHDQARSRAYRWGEDGLAGISDDKQQLCFALALWNGKDPILKERLFGLTNSESNHGEDVKEYYFYLDSTPTHSYMKYLYKYPQAAFPYANLVDTSRGRSRTEFEYELLDTGVFDDNRYFDVFVEYAKEAPEDLLIQITIHNRGPEAAELHVLPTLWFRNQWSWAGNVERPTLAACGVAGAAKARSAVIKAVHPKLGERYLSCEGAPTLLFTENETNTQRIFGVPNRSPYVKDSINNYVVHGQKDAVNPEQKGTKASAQYRVTVQPGGSQVIRLRLSDAAPEQEWRLRRFRGRARHSPQGSRRVLRHGHPAFTERRSGQRHAAGARGHAVEQAVLLLRRGQMARRARQRSVQGQSQAGAAQRPMAPHVQRRRHLHARQMGISLVRRLGPRFPRPRADAGRSRLRQATTEADAARTLHAPQRPNPGL